MKNLNEIKTRRDLSDCLGIPLKFLTYILYVKKVDTMYSTFRIPKKSGGERIINAPADELKSIQKRLAWALWKYQKTIWEDRNIQPNISHGFEKDKGIFSNAKIHKNKRFVLNIDLADFFGSFHFGRVRGYFNKNNDFKMPIEIATIVAQLACYDGVLPQGSPCSPIITNLICQSFDMRVLKIAKKFKLDYTRYADDLTFSTNNKDFLLFREDFEQGLIKTVERSGFKVNDKKTRLMYRDSKQEVTGLVVNKKINVDSRYYRNTRAMANHLYSTGSFYIEGEKGTLAQLEGRFSFINQAEKYNNKIDIENKKIKKGLFVGRLSAREEQYRKFLFYKYFLANDKPLIITEGKTDVPYIKAALKNLYAAYPGLVSKTGEDNFSFGVSFLRRSKRLRHLMAFSPDGADTMKNIYNFYTDKDKSFFNYYKHFTETFNLEPQNPVILIFDNELKKRKKGEDKPLYKFLNHAGLESKKEVLKKELFLNIIGNLYVLTVPLLDGKDEAEIEDLFDEETQATEIDGRKFSRNDEKGCYGKNEFSKHIAANYRTIDFSRFKEFLDKLQEIASLYV